MPSFSDLLVHLNCEIPAKTLSPVADKQQKPTSKLPIFDSRSILLGGGASFVAISTLNHAFRPLIVNAEEVESGKKEEDAGVLDTIKSMFDRNEKTKSGKESYVAIEKVIRSLANFYSKAGHFAALPEKVKSGILYDLSTAESFL